MKRSERNKSISLRDIKNSMSKLLEQVGKDKLSLKDARNKVSLLLDQLESGEEILITRDGNPIAKVVPWA